jgi:hypothetical protein
MEFFEKKIKRKIVKLILVIIAIQLLLMRTAYAEMIEFPVASEFVDHSVMQGIWDSKIYPETGSYYTPPGNADGSYHQMCCNKNVDDNPNFSLYPESLIGVIGNHQCPEFTPDGYKAQSWGWDQGEFSNRFKDRMYGDPLRIDSNGKTYFVVALGQAWGIVGDKVEFTWRNDRTGNTFTLNTVMADAKSPDDWYNDLGWFPEGPYGWYADSWGYNVLEFCGVTTTLDNSFTNVGGPDAEGGHWVLQSADNQGGFEGFVGRNTRISPDVAMANGGSGGRSGGAGADADYVDLDAREFKFAGLPKRISYDGLTHPLVNLFKSFGRILDLLAGLLINMFKRVFIGWGRIIEMGINLVFYKTEKGY